MNSLIYKRYVQNFEINLLDCKLLGRGNNGVVYLLPEGKIIKICFEPESCEKEYAILKRVNGNRYFPRVYGMNGNYMIRDYVDGIILKDYIKEHGLDRNLSIKIIDLLREFKRLRFSKIDLRCKDIIVQPNGNLMVIDPKKFYTKQRHFPRHLSKGLYKLGVLDYFMSVVRDVSPKLYNQWHKDIEDYIQEKKEELD
ncbi:MAG: putative Ser/Thr protein kinase [Anaerosolibacter sp.]|jgi:predicted Ser/Thr protein kinase|uniref:serine/threonine-protein kinase n=1 Tax=Anaerosolibacter sp. TaxID=1872527 RepID=UPI00260DE2A5|nr:serine/threonine-protein kinase [Anaerosolibacter sp.]MDF2546820.1 putative Ser/Thr protein kinase [Anaerosolibacter sp.]